MSHEITESDRAAYGSVEAWHRIGTVYGRPMTLEEAVAEIGFTVSLSPTTLPGTTIPVPGHFFVMRDDLAFDNPARVMATVKGRYTPIQNEELAHLVAAFAGAVDAEIESAFTMQGGRKAVIAAKFKGDVALRGNGGSEPVQRYVWGRTSHDGVWTTGLRLAATLPVCMNTVRMALGESSNEIAVRHTQTSQVALANVEKAAAGAVAYFGDLLAAGSFLADTPVDGKTVRRYLTTLFPAPAKPAVGASDNAAKLYERGLRATEKARKAVEDAFEGQEEATRKGTLWGLAQAASGLAEHTGRVRVAGGAEDAEEGDVAETRLLSLLDGALGQSVDLPYKVALKVVKYAA